MRVVRLRRGADRRLLPSGEEVVLCPRCRARWLTRAEGSADEGFCPHLRFVWYAGVYGGRPEYAPGWSPLEFERRFRERYRRLTRAEALEPDGVPAMYDPGILARLLRTVDVPEVEAVRYLPLLESDPGAFGEAAVFWGFHLHPTPAGPAPG